MSGAAPVAGALVATAVVVRAGAAVLLDQVDVECPAGRLVVVVGENGAGKSTLLDALCGLRAPDEGRVRLGDLVVAALRPRDRARVIACLSQHDPSSFALSAEARIGQGLAPRRGLHALLDDAARVRVHTVADELGVAHLLQRDLASLSSGERRRVHVARALVDDEARVYVLDEPHAGVDVKHQARVSAALRARAGRGAVVVVSVHDLGVALQLADVVIGLRAGRVVVRGALDAAGVDAIYGIRGARIVDDADGLGVVLPR